MKKINLLLLLGVLLLVLSGVARVEAESRARGAAQLEQALRRASAACYAAEGFYPPSLSYVQEHYGLHYDRDRYVVHYEAVAANLMPEITVMEK